MKCNCPKNLPVGWHMLNCSEFKKMADKAESLVKTFPTASVDSMENLADKRLGENK